ncbi:hypothetical protein [Cohnella sp. REN36]|uniref:hypothetical protein n=1 Tax=Cohnella sp. REN36 TaxID=2887347 RepID=UPI001D147FAD|nr:hypothetical protein [Cohnella sp. REN36]MCC3377135.1 hypothetical protein [Cohnella sp. REN36]
MVSTLILIGAVVCLVGGVLSVVVMRKKQNNEWDMTADKKMLDNPVKSNPIIYVYWIFPIAVIVGAILFGLYYK